MADAKTKAPLKSEATAPAQTNEELALSQVFDPEKRYVFEAAFENEQRERPVLDADTGLPVGHRKFKPYQNIVMTSQIVWKGQRKMLRYYDGCTSIFVEEQPQDKELMQQLISQSQPRALVNGKLACYGDERMLLLYLNLCSWNSDSPFRTRNATAVFKSLNPDKLATIETQKLDLQEKAFDLAREASEKKMRIHASYLQIPTTDFDSGNERSPQEIRVDYRKFALKNPQTFLDSFTDSSLELKYNIAEAFRSGIISNRENPGVMVWANSGRAILDIAGLQSEDAIVTKLYEFSQTTEGEEFKIQIESLSA